MATDLPTREGEATASVPTEKGTEEKQADGPRSAAGVLGHGLSQAMG